MNAEKLYIKNMVCDRCKMVVKSELEKLGLTPLNIDLGEVILEKPLDEHQKLLIENALAPLGFD